MQWYTSVGQALLWKDGRKRQENWPENRGPANLEFTQHDKNNKRGSASTGEKENQLPEIGL